MAFARGRCSTSLSPSNFLLTNPEVLARTIAGGREEPAAWRGKPRGGLAARRRRPAAGGGGGYPVGEAVAITSGVVVFRNRLIEVIQYRPATEGPPEPVLIVSAPIMKYYILDLSPENSLVRYLVEQGYTVFVVSWNNPAGMIGIWAWRTSMHLGPLAALDAIGRIVPDRKVHGVTT